jgi:hypothetical protein
MLFKTINIQQKKSYSNYTRLPHDMTLEEAANALTEQPHEAKENEEENWLALRWFSLLAPSSRRVARLWRSCGRGNHEAFVFRFPGVFVVALLGHASLGRIACNLGEKSFSRRVRWSFRCRTPSLSPNGASAYARIEHQAYFSNRS